MHVYNQPQLYIYVCVSENGGPSKSPGMFRVDQVFWCLPTIWHLFGPAWVSFMEECGSLRTRSGQAQILQRLVDTLKSEIWRSRASVIGATFLIISKHHGK